jgi:hypothetical protein
MRKMLLFLMSLLFISGLSNSLLAQWAENKYAREDAKYVRVLQSNEDIQLDGVEDAVWAEADSVVVGYGQANQLPGSGYDIWAGMSQTGDSANAVCKFLYKAPYIYLLFKVVDKSVGGWDWGESDALIMAFKEVTADHSWDQAWDKRMEHFYTRMYKWAFPDSFTTPPIGAQPLFMGNDRVAGGMEAWRTAAQKDRWEAVTTVIGGVANDSLPDQGYIMEHRIRVDSLGFNVNGDILPFSFSIFDGDNFLDSTDTNDAHTRTWWNCPWNENWYYGALFIDPNVTTASPPGLIPPVDYVVPHLFSGDAITVDGDLSDWNTTNALHFRAKYQDEAGFNAIRGFGNWASGYQQIDVTGVVPPPPFPPVLDGPDVDYWVTFDDANLYVGAKVSDKIVTVPYHSTGAGTGFRDGITFYMTPRIYVNGNGIFPSKLMTVGVDSNGNAQAADDLIMLADTGGVTYALTLGDSTNINDPNNIDNGFSVELKIPFSTFAYPPTLGDSVIFIAGEVNDIDVFDDTLSNYFAKAWWFQQQSGQHGPGWNVLGPAGATDVKDQTLIPLSLKLFNNYPNPFNPTTTIQYTLNSNANVSLYVYNILGQTVSVMNQSNIPAGTSEFRFNGKGLASGVYFYQLKVQNLTDSKISNSQVKKMILLK